MSEGGKSLEMHLNNDDKSGPQYEMPPVVRKHWSLPIRE
jgi:hypothetical protein